MSDLIKDGVDWFRSKLKAKAGVTITYTRGPNSVSVTATVGRTEYEREEASGVVLRFESRDFIVEADDLILNSVTVKPQDGDKIVYNGETYEVLSLDGARPYEPTDNYETQWRIHTKQIVTA